MTMDATPSRTMNGPAHDAVSTSSSTLVNPGIGDKVRRKASPRLAVGGSGIIDDNAIPSGASWHRRDTRQARSTSGLPSPRRKMEYPDDHRCSDQETASGLCGCTNEDSSEDSSQNQHAQTSDEEEEEGPAVPSNRDADNAGDEDYDRLVIAARRKKLLSEANMRRSLQTSLREPSSSSKIAVHSDPIMPSQRLVGLSRTIISGAQKESDGEMGASGEVDRLWASSPIPPTSHSGLDTASSIQRGEVVQSPALGESTLRQFPRRARGHPHTSSPRKSIDSFYQKLYQEEQQRQDELRARKEAARERRRQELKRRSTGWPRLDTETIHDRSKEAEGSSSVLELATGSPPAHVEADNASSQPISPLQSSDPAIEIKTREKSPEAEADVSPSRIAPRLSPIKPSAEMYRARLAALRASTPTRGEQDDHRHSISPSNRDRLASGNLKVDAEEGTSTDQYSSEPQAGQRAEKAHERRDLSVTGRQPLSDTPLQRAFASPAFPGTYFSPSMARPSPPAFSRHLLRARQSGRTSEADNSIARSARLPKTEAADLKTDEDESEDQVTLGSDYLGQATRQSTPPRGKGSVGMDQRAKQGSSMQDGETSRLASEDPIRETLQQLTAALREVDQMDSVPALKERLSAVLSTSGLVDPNRSAEEQQLALTELSQDALYTSHMDDAFMDKLDNVRRRLTNLSKVKFTGKEVVKPAPARRWTKMSIVYFVLQLVFGACIILYASELRARHLFLNTYHNPFFPGEMDLYTPLTAQSYLQPLVEEWAGPALLDSFLTGDMATQDILRSMITGPDRAKTAQHLLLKAATLLGFDSRDCFYSPVRIPT